jgi:hypothetical protein
LRISWLDDDDLRTLLHHFNLSSGFQIACGVSLCAHPLYRCERVFLLRGGSIAERRSPRNILGEIVENGRELGQRLDGGIPVLLLDCVLQRLGGEIWVGLQKIIRVDHLIGKSSGAKDLRNESIRIERDGRNERVQIAVR